LCRPQPIKGKKGAPIFLGKREHSCTPVKGKRGYPRTVCNLEKERGWPFGEKTPAPPGKKGPISSAWVEGGWGAQKKMRLCLHHWKKREKKKSIGLTSKKRKIRHFPRRRKSQRAGAEKGGGGEWTPVQQFGD